METGTYKPQIHTHYLPHLSLSFARHTTSLNTTFVLLSSDYSKSLHLQADRSLEFHTPQGCHYTTRLPRYGRDLKYDQKSAEALIPAVGVNGNGKGEVYRLNLEIGRYMRALEVDVGGDDLEISGGGALQGGVAVGAVNVGAVAESTHNLLAFGTSQGTVEFWDSRSRDRIGLLQSPRGITGFEEREEVTALEFDASGLGVATGSSTGLVRLYDLRSPQPFLKKDQGYGYPIHTITYLKSNKSIGAQASGPMILSSDKRIIKIWDSQEGTPWTSVEPAVDINSVAWCRDSGMILTANEGRQQHSFFIPQLGPAPRWCSFLDNLVEEMAEDPDDPNAYIGEKAGSIFDNFKFLTGAQLESLNLSHLIGTTSLLRPYMHGYFVAQRLYEEAKLIANPFVWEEQRNKRVKEKIDHERESRIRGNKKVAAKVNKRLAERLMERQEKEDRRHARRALENGRDQEDLDVAHVKDAEPTFVDARNEKSNLLADSRFAKLFSDENFRIDETSREFQSLNPSTKPTGQDRGEDEERRLTAVEQEALVNIPGSSTEGTDSSEEIDSVRRPRPKRKLTVHGSAPPQMQVSFSKGRRDTKDRSFGSRTEKRKKMEAKGLTTAIGGEKEITFAPEKKGKGALAQEDRNQDRRRNKDRRSASGNVFRNF